ncbi:MAG: SPASM domain-containing protein [Firmicutes bacterium]|nr:SPASM domain-containing protein [Bacillota bacterium]
MDVAVGGYKLSRYNFVFPRDNGKALAYNAVTNSLAEIDEDVEAALRNPSTLSKMVTMALEGNREKDILSKLEAGRFIIPQTLDEIDYMRVMYDQSKFATSSLGLTIAPTLDCNFRCTYCYERHRVEHMTPEVEAALVDFVKRMMRPVRFLNVTWYGGEPLLALDGIIRLSREFMQLCDKHSCEYSASMITNGYLLNPGIIPSLKEIKVRTVQVTLDGPPQVHDKRRFLVGGAPTFEVLMSNLQAMAGQFDIPLRINVDKENSGSIPELLRIFKRMDLIEPTTRIYPYLAPGTAYTEACESVYSNCLRGHEFAEFEIRAIRELLEEDINLVHYPVKSPGACGAPRTMSYVVDPDGLLYKCWNEVGTSEMAVGNLGDSAPMFDARLMRWLRYTPFDRHECCSCAFFPLCTGGCPYVALWLPDKIEENCTRWKYYLGESLKLFADVRQRQRSEHPASSMEAPGTRSTV